MYVNKLFLCINGLSETVAELNPFFESRTLSDLYF